MDLITGNALKLYLSSLMRFSKARFVYKCSHQFHPVPVSGESQTENTTNIVSEGARYITPNHIQRQHISTRNREPKHLERFNDVNQRRDFMQTRRTQRVTDYP